MDDTYSFGVCMGCRKEKPLKNGRCEECNKSIGNEIPEFISNLFGGT